MKQFMIRSMFAAATLVAVAGISSAETLTAEIPFAFRAGRTLMAPGSYQVKVDHSGGTAIFHLYNYDNHAGLVLLSYGTSEPDKAWVASGLPKIAFECAAERCALRQLWTGDRYSVYQFSSPKPSRGEPALVTQMRVISARTE
jgi:hypothetical protein